MRGGRAGSLAASPTLVGAVTVLVVVVAVFLSYQANQGLPFVPTYKRLGRAAERQHPGPGQRGPDRRHPGRPDHDDRAGHGREHRRDGHGRRRRQGGHGAEPGPRAAPRGLDGDRPLALGARPQVPRARSAATPRRASRPARRSRSRQATPEPVEIDQVFNTFDDPTRAAIQANLTEFGNALAGRGQNLNAAHRRPAPAGRAPRARDAQPRARRDRPRAASSAGSRRPRPRPRRSPRSRASSSSTSRRTFGAFADVARPYIQETISKVARDRGRGDRDAAADPAVHRQHRRPLRRAAPRLRRASPAGLR